jgi:hypothetical protein
MCWSVGISNKCVNYHSGTTVWVAELLSTNENYVHPRAMLVSGVQQVNHTSCVHFSLYYIPGAAVNVRVPSCITGGDSDGLLLRLEAADGDRTLRPLWLPLTVSYAGCDAQLQWEAEFDRVTNQEAIMAYLTDVAVLPGSCLSQGNAQINSFTAMTIQYK